MLEAAFSAQAEAISSRRLCFLEISDCLTPDYCEGQFVAMVQDVVFLAIFATCALQVPMTEDDTGWQKLAVLQYRRLSQQLLSFELVQ